MLVQFFNQLLAEIQVFRTIKKQSSHSVSNYVMLKHAVVINGVMLTIVSPLHLDRS